MLDQGLGEGRLCRGDPDPGKEGSQPGSIRPPGVVGGDAIEDQIDEPGPRRRDSRRIGAESGVLRPLGSSFATITENYRVR